MARTRPVAVHTGHGPLRSPSRENRGISRDAVRRLARNGGVKRIRPSVYTTTTDLVRTKLEQIVPRAMMYCFANGRKVVTSQDIAYAVRDTTGMRSPTGFGHDIQGLDSPVAFKLAFDVVSLEMNKETAEPVPPTVYARKPEPSNTSAVLSGNVMPTIEREHEFVAEDLFEGKSTLFNSELDSFDDLDFDYDFDGDFDDGLSFDTALYEFEEKLQAMEMYNQCQEAQDRVSRWIDDVEAARVDASIEIVDIGIKEEEKDSKLQNCCIDCNSTFNDDTASFMVITEASSEDEDDDDDEQLTLADATNNRTIPSFFRVSKPGHGTTCAVTK